uniref:Uncharacterized protein n=1 Tax=Arundo donax TaxID=35708 RepID=A0A0A9HIU9_ARUDO
MSSTHAAITPRVMFCRVVAPRYGDNCTRGCFRYAIERQVYIPAIFQKWCIFLWFQEKLIIFKENSTDERMQQS